MGEDIEGTHAAKSEFRLGILSIFLQEVYLGCDLVCTTATRKPLLSLDTITLSASLCQDLHPK